MIILQDFLSEIEEGQPVDFNSMAHTLCQKANMGHDVVQMIAMKWLRQLILLAKSRLKEQYADILAAVLPILSHSSQGISSVIFLSKLNLSIQESSKSCCNFPPMFVKLERFLSSTKTLPIRLSWYLLTRGMCIKYCRVFYFFLWRRV